MDLKKSLCIMVVKTGRKLLRAMRESLIPFGLTTAQFFLLMTLYQKDRILISVLAKKAGLDKATLTGMLDRLERDGLIKRETAPNDRRAIEICLRDKALSMREDLTRLYNETNQSFLAVLNKEEKQALYSITEKFENKDLKQLVIKNKPRKKQGDSA